MPRYLVRRALGDITDEQLDTAAEHSTRVRVEQFPVHGHEHSHVVRTADGGLTAFCVYSAPSEADVREHAAAAGIPADEVHEIERDLIPAKETA
jgi:hypothetical protein